MKNFLSLQAKAFRLFGFSAFLSLFPNLVTAQSAGSVLFRAFPLNCEQDCNTRCCISFTGADFNDGTCDIDISFNTPLDICDLGEFTEISPNEVGGNFLVAADGTWTYCFTVTKDQANVNFIINVKDHETQQNVFNSTFALKAPSQINGFNELSTLISNGILPSATVAANTPQNIAINGTLIIDENYSFNNSIIQMGPDATIIVESGFVLSSFQSRFFSCGPLKYQGIVLQNESTLSMESTVMFDAKLGILATNESSIVAIKNSFVRCDVGMQLGFFSANTINNLLVANAFTGTGTEIGIRLLNVNNEVKIGSIVGIFARFLAQYTNMRKGIEITGGGVVDVFDNAFTDITEMGIDARGGPNAELKVRRLNPPPNKCEAGNIFRFENVRKGIVAKNTLLTVSDYNFSPVEENAIEIDDSGVRVSDLIVIKRNFIYALDNGIKIITGPSRGIIEDNCIQKDEHNAGSPIHLIGNPMVSNGAWDITRNELETPIGTSSLSLTNVKYIRATQNEINHNGGSSAVVVSGGANNSLTCNNINLGFLGIDYRNSPDGIIECNNIQATNGMYVWGTSDQTLMLGNNIKGNSSDMRYRTNAVTRRHKQSGNLFDLPSRKAVHDGPAAIVQRSPYIVNSNSNSLFLPQFIVSPTIWFDDVNTSPIYQCEHTNLVCNLPIWTPFTNSGSGSRSLVVDDSLDLLISTTGLGFTAPAKAAMDWTLKQHLYKRLYEANQIPAEFLSFYLAQGQGSIGYLQNIHTTFENAHKPSAIQLATINSRRAIATSLQNSLDAIKVFKEINGEPTSEIDITVLPQYFDLCKKIGDTLRIIGTINETINGIVANQLDGLISFNNAVSNTLGIYSLNARTVNHIYFNYLKNGHVFSTTANAQLNYIAAQCPNMGGDAVFAARALLLYEGEVSYSDEACVSTEGIGGNSKQIATSVPSINETFAYPNPASEMVHINRSLDNLNENATATLMDLSGRILMTQVVESQIKNFDLNIADLQSGMYLIQVKYQNGKSETLKINVIK